MGCGTNLAFSCLRNYNLIQNHRTSTFKILPSFCYDSPSSTSSLSPQSYLYSYKIIINIQCRHSNHYSTNYIFTNLTVIHLFILFEQKYFFIFTRYKKSNYKFEKQLIYRYFTGLDHLLSKKQKNDLEPYYFKLQNQQYIYKFADAKFSISNCPVKSSRQQYQKQFMEYFEYQVDNTAPKSKGPKNLLDIIRYGLPEFKAGGQSQWRAKIYCHGVIINNYHLVLLVSNAISKYVRIQMVKLNRMEFTFNSNYLLMENLLQISKKIGLSMVFNSIILEAINLVQLQRDWRKGQQRAYNDKSFEKKLKNMRNDFQEKGKPQNLQSAKIVQKQVQIPLSQQEKVRQTQKQLLKILKAQKASKK